MQLDQLSYEECVETFVQLAIAEPFAMSECRRYLNWPGQANGYWLGQKTFRDAAERARAERGEDFDMPEFMLLVTKFGFLSASDLDTLVTTYLKWRTDPDSLNEDDFMGDTIEEFLFRQAAPSIGLGRQRYLSEEQIFNLQNRRKRGDDGFMTFSDVRRRRQAVEESKHRAQKKIDEARARMRQEHPDMPLSPFAGACASYPCEIP
jgi:hypothetical protein